MKKHFVTKLIAGAAIALCMGFSACGDDSDDDSKGPGNNDEPGVEDSDFVPDGPAALFDGKLLKSFTTQYGDEYNYVYDSNGRITRIGNLISIDYENRTCIIKGLTYDIRFTRAGYISSITRNNVDDQRHGSCYFKYNKNDELIHFSVDWKWGEYGYETETVDLTWRDGNIVHNDYTYGHYGDGYSKGSYDLYYNDEGYLGTNRYRQYQAFITSCAILYVFDYYPLAIGGLLGKGPANICVGFSHRRGSSRISGSYSCKLNKNGTISYEVEDDRDYRWEYEYREYY